MRTLMLFAALTLIPTIPTTASAKQVCRIVWRSNGQARMVCV